MRAQWSYQLRTPPVFGLVLAMILTACNSDGLRRELGHSVKLGQGEATSYIDYSGGDVPEAIGLLLSAGALQGLPQETDGHHCFDGNDDGQIDRVSECNHANEWFIPLPGSASRNGDIPFAWILLDWNTHGHGPPGVYDHPHFDVHFYIQSMEDAAAIDEGECGPERVRCDQFALATKPLAERYLPEGYINVDAVTPGMGNHLIAPSAPEFNGQTFMRTWIYGAYDGEITFVEEMLTRAYLLSQPDACFAIPQPQAYAVAGFYPTLSCIRYDPQFDQYSVSMEGLQYRGAG